jgi:hypothetical protein
MAINLDHVTEQITVTDTAANASLTVNPKGTGAFNIAAGSSGLNLSNGGTVTGITLISGGSGYTSVPSVTLSAPTTAGGVQATAQAVVYVWSNPLTSAGTGYTVGNTLTAVGGTGTPYSVTVSTINGSGGVTGVAIAGYGAYTVTPTNPVTFTGGSGSGFTSNMSWIVGTPVTITNAGSGYVEQPTVTFSGGGTGLATAYATVGSGTTVKSLGSTIDFSTPNGVGFRVFDSSQTASNYWTATGGTNAVFRTVGANQAYIDINGSVPLSLRTAVTLEQLRVAHTASAVNYVQVTGAATGVRPLVLMQGSDANIGVNISSKGNGDVLFTGGSANFVLFRALGGASFVNYVQATSSATGVAVQLAAIGSDTNIPLVLQPKGTGALQAQLTDSTATGGNARGANAVDWQTARGLASQVANGTVAVIGGGQNNTSSGLLTTVAGGFNNNSSGNSAFIGGGQYNVASQFRAVAVGGGVNTSAGYYNFIGGGFTNSGTANAAVTSQFGTTNSTTSVTLNGANAAIKPGQLVTGSLIDADTYVNSVSGTFLSLTKNALASGGTTLSFFTPHGVVVGGGNNQATGSHSFIGGGGHAGTADYRNVASGDWSAIVGGMSNTASASGAFVGGGGVFSGISYPNLSSGISSVVVGGLENTSSGQASFVGGGSQNVASNIYAFVGSGRTNAASGLYSSIVGGGNNQASGSHSFVGGGGDAGNTTNRNVASGDWSTVGGGRRNTASGAGSTVAGGGTSGPDVYPNTANGVLATISGGWNSTASGTFAVIGGGQSNIASGYGSSILGGSDNVSSGTLTTVIGQLGTARAITGNTIFSACNNPISYASGINQSALLILARQTTDATATRLLSDNNASATTNQVILPNNSAYFFTGEVVSGVTGGGNTKGWTIEGVIKRGANAASTALVGTPTVTSTYADAGASTWVIAVTADTTNGGLAVTFTGQASTTIRTVAQIRTTEMTF